MSPQLSQAQLNEKMQEAVNARDLEAIAQFVKQGADLDLTDRYNNSALILATIGNDADLVRLLINKGADLEVRNSFHNTALQQTILNQRLEILQLLVAAGAVIDRNDPHRAEANFYSAAPLLREALKERERNAGKCAAEKVRRLNVAEKQQLLKNKAARQQLKFKL